jgi:hypothetical protein
MKLCKVSWKNKVTFVHRLKYPVNEEYSELYMNITDQ